MFFSFSDVNIHVFLWSDFEYSHIRLNPAVVYWKTRCRLNYTSLFSVRTCFQIQLKDLPVYHPASAVTSRCSFRHKLSSSSSEGITGWSQKRVVIRSCAAHLGSLRQARRSVFNQLFLGESARTGDVIQKAYLLQNKLLCALTSDPWTPLYTWWVSSVFTMQGDKRLRNVLAGGGS